MKKSGNKNIIKLRNRDLKEIPPEVFQNQETTTLDVSGNQIEVIPKEISQLKNVKKLILSHNNISHLPEEMAELSELREIVLSHNKLEVFPNVLLKLKKLKLICLNSNYITQIPVDLPSKLPALKHLYLKHNVRLPKIIETLSIKGYKYLKLYLENQHQHAFFSKDTQYDNIKIKKLKIENVGLFDELEIDFHHRITCLLGQNGTGKTTIVRAIALCLTGIEHKDIVNDKSLDSFVKIYGLNQKKKAAYLQMDYDVRKKSSSNAFFLMPGTDENITVTPNLFTYKNQKTGELKLPVAGFLQNRNETEGKPQTKLPKNVDDIIPLIINKGYGHIENFEHWLVEKKADNQLYFIEKTFQVISKIIGEKFEFLYTQSGDVWVKTRYNPNGIPMSLLSLGFQDSIGWIGYFMQCLYKAYPGKEKFYEEPAICIIDELDIYMHPQWQRTIIDVLQECFPGTQFIITTHSPLIASQVAPEQRVIFAFDENNHIRTKKGIAPIGDDPNDLLLDDFDMDTVLTPYGEKMWNEYIDLKRKIHFSDNETEKQQLLTKLFDISSKYKFSLYEKDYQK